MSVYDVILVPYKWNSKYSKTSVYRRHLEGKEEGTEYRYLEERDSPGEKSDMLNGSTVNT